MARLILTFNDSNNMRQMLHVTPSDAANAVIEAVDGKAARATGWVVKPLATLLLTAMRGVLG